MKELNQEFILQDVEKYKSDLVLERLLLRLFYFSFPVVFIFPIICRVFDVVDKIITNNSRMIGVYFGVIICYSVVKYYKEEDSYDNFHVKYKVNLENGEMEIFFFSGKKKLVDLSLNTIFHPTKNGQKIFLRSDQNKDSFDLNIRVQNANNFVILLEKYVKSVDGIRYKYYDS